MNYYKFNIGDYAAATRHLTMLEHGAYRLLMDVYYTTEQPLPADVKATARKTGARTKDEIAAVETVLNDFFVLTENGWIQNRCDSEIAGYMESKKNHWATNLTKPQRAAIQGARNASKASATPAWLTKEDRAQIAEIYALAATMTAKTGERHEVDHIVPIRSSVVCGMHVPWNLQILTSSKNKQKSNSFEVAA